MSKRLILVLALALVAGLSLTAYAEVQNIKVSGDIKETAIARQNMTLSHADNADFGKNVGALLSQVRVRVDADLTDNVSATIRLLNERVWGVEKNATNNGGDTDIALDLANVTLKEFLYSPLTLVVGRQELRYGNAMIIGDVDTNMIAANHASGTKVLPKSLDDLSLRKSFDAIKAILNYDPLVIDLVYSRIDTPTVGAPKLDTNLYGLNLNYSLTKELNTELYLWSRQRRISPSAALTTSKNEHIETVGAKVNYAGVPNLNVSLEAAGQFGHKVRNANIYANDATSGFDYKMGVGQTATLNNSIQQMGAFAIQGITSYVLKDIKLSPVLSGSYTYLSGDKYKPQGRNFKGWIPMYEDQLGGTLINKLIYNNIQLVSLGVSIKPLDDLKLNLDYYWARLNNAYPDSATAVVINNVPNDPTYKMNADKKYFGSEVEIGLTYDYTEDVQLALSGGMFVPGDAFSKSTNTNAGSRKTASQVMGSMKVTF